MTQHSETLAVAFVDIPDLTISPSIGPLSLSAVIRREGYRSRYYDLSREIVIMLSRAETLQQVRSIILTLLTEEQLKPSERLVCKALISFMDKNLLPQMARTTLDDKTLQDFLWYVYSLIFDNRYQTYDRWCIDHPLLNTFKMTFLLPAVFYGGLARRVRQRLFRLDSFRALFTRCLGDAAVVGFSSNYRHTYPIFLELAQLAKELRPGVKVVVGGHAAFYKVNTEGVKASHFAQIDYLIPSEGELTFLALLKSGFSAAGIAGVPNLTYLKDGKVVTNAEGYTRDLDTLPAPDYQAYLGTYGYPAYRSAHITSKMLFYEIGRGCHWRRCTFCAFCRLNREEPYRVKRPAKVVDDLLAIVRDTGINYFWLVTEYMTLDYAKELAREILSRGADLQWRSYTRFDPRLDQSTLRLLHDAGCRYLGFGLESGNQRINNILRKGVNIKVAERIMADCKAIGIVVRLYTIIAFPMETLNDALDTFRYIHRNRKNIDALCMFLYRCTPYSQMYMNPDEYGIEGLGSVERNEILAKFYRTKKTLLNLLRHAYSAYLHRDNPSIRVLVY